jgi:hypothetical protein
MVLGRVAAAREVIVPPFGTDDAVAIRVKVIGNQRRANEHLFSGFSAVDFKIRDADGQEVRVDMSKQHEWKFSMNPNCTYEAWNVFRDSSKRGMVCGGDGLGQHDKLFLRPHAEAFWREFGTGKDNYDDVGDIVGHAWQIAGPRKALETSIRLGDAIAVIGTLRSGEDGLFLEGGDGCAITNDPGIAEQLTTVSEFSLPTATDEKVRMRNSKFAGVAKNTPDN